MPVFFPSAWILRMNSPPFIRYMIGEKSPRIKRSGDSSPMPRGAPGTRRERAGRVPQLDRREVLGAADVEDDLLAAPLRASAAEQRADHKAMRAWPIRRGVSIVPPSGSPNPNHQFRRSATLIRRGFGSG